MHRLGEIRHVESKSRPGHFYPMVFAPVSGWVHADNTCPAFKECRHRKEAEEKMTSLVVQENDKALAERNPFLVVRWDAAAISAGVDVAIAAKWAYDLPGGGGQGVGARGAEEGVRAMASRGEIIRVDRCDLVGQNDREGFFTATASRYVISPEGAEIKLDSQTRGKRVSKWEDHSANYIRDHPQAPTEYFNKNWYELGLVKAARNAALALMPSNIKTALLKAGLDAADQMKRGGGDRPQQQQRQAPTQRQQQRSREPIDGTVQRQAPPNVDPETGEMKAGKAPAAPNTGKLFQDLVSSVDNVTQQRIVAALWKRWPEARGEDDSVDLKAIADRAALAKWLDDAQRANGPPAE